MTKREKKFINKMNLWIILHNIDPNYNYGIIPRCEYCEDREKCGYVVEIKKYGKEKKSIRFSTETLESKKIKLGHDDPAISFFHACPEAFKKVRKLP